MKQKAFTLIELLVVIAIIGVIASITLVNLSDSRGKAKIASGYQFSQSVDHALGAYAVGVWSFDRYSDPITDLSGYGNHCAVFGAAEEPNGIIRKALKFDNSTGDNINCGNSKVFDITDNITIMAWIKPDKLLAGSYHAIVSKRNDSDTNRQFHFDVRFQGKLHLGWRLSDGWHSGDTNDVVVKLNEWQHVAVTYDGISQPKFYVNGVSEPSSMTGSITLLPSTTRPVTIGAYGTGNPGDSYSGLIDEVRIYNVTLSAGEIQNYYVEGLKRYKLVWK